MHRCFRTLYDWIWNIADLLYAFLSRSWGLYYLPMSIVTNTDRKYIINQPCVQYWLCVHQLRHVYVKISPCYIQSNSHSFISTACFNRTSDAVYHMYGGNSRLRLKLSKWGRGRNRSAYSMTSLRSRGPSYRYKDFHYTDQISLSVYVMAIRIHIILGVSIIKVRCSKNNIFFIMEIRILGKTVFILERTQMRSVARTHMLSTNIHPHKRPLPAIPRATRGRCGTPRN